MRVAFSSLSPHIQLQVVNKLSLDEAPSFELASKLTKAVAQRVKTPFAPLTVSSATIYYRSEKLEFTLDVMGKIHSCLTEIPELRFTANRVEIWNRLTEEYCGKLLSFLRRCGTTFVELEMTIYETIRPMCSPASFRELLQIADVKAVKIQGMILPEYVRILPDHLTKVVVWSQLEDDDLIRIKASYIDIGYCRIGCTALNRVLKEWSERKRKIDFLKIHSMRKLVKEEILDGIAYSSTDKEFLFKMNNGNEILYIFFDERGAFEASLDPTKNSFIIDLYYVDSGEMY